MRGTRIRLLAIMVAILIVTDYSVAADRPAQGRALLVGCTKYDHLDPSLHLQGPGNDVLLMRDLLCTRFGFPLERIVMLTESAGQPNLRPVRANIEREFLRLGREAEAGEQIVIFLAGHGSQQPVVNPSPDNPEPDGLDELFLPADVKGWDLGIGQVPNAIIDDELGVWLREIERRRAAVTVIVDSCHAGSMTRGVGERVRQLPPGTLVPTDVIKTAQQKASAMAAVRGHVRNTGDQPVERILDVPTVVAIYAAQSTEATVEQLLPPNGQDRKPYGLLTFTLNQVISRSSQPMTYRELVRQIQTQYYGSGRSFPTPMIEGLNRDREVFGTTNWSDRTQIRLTKSGRGWSINAGLLQNITQESVLAVLPTDGPEGAKALGYVRVQRARTVDADVITCEFDGQPEIKALTDGSRCELAYLDLGDLRLRIAITAPDPISSNQKEWMNRLKVSLNRDSSVAKQARMVQLVDKESDADWMIRVREHDMIVIPAEASLSDPNVIPITAFGPRPFDDSSLAWIGSAIDRIARAANLKKLASSESTGDSNADAVHVELDIERSNSTDTKDRSDRMTLRDGEQMTIHLKNPCQFPVDVTLLAIDTACGIDAMFPSQGEINRLQPGDSVNLSAQVVAKSRGLEHLVAIVVKADREVVDFTSLAQPSLEIVRNRGGPARNSLNSPFGELLKHAVFAEGQTRGVKRSTTKAHRLQLLTWAVEPKLVP